MEFPKEPGSAEGFFPHGAVAFFVSMLVFYVVLWLVLFFVMGARS